MLENLNQSFHSSNRYNFKSLNQQTKAVVYRANKIRNGKINYFSKANSLRSAGNGWYHHWIAKLLLNSNGLIYDRIEKAIDNQIW